MSSFNLGYPVVQHLGFEMDYFKLRVSFPIQEVIEPGVGESQDSVKEVGARAVILKFRADDLPTHQAGCHTLTMDIGQAIRRQFELEG